MTQTAADILIDVLQEWGVDTIFGLPGDGINGIMEALRSNGSAYGVPGIWQKSSPRPTRTRPSAPVRANHVFFRGRRHS
jgi:thiamine pyrophosphate-dependent enzyme